MKDGSQNNRIGKLDFPSAEERSERSERSPLLFHRNDAGESRSAQTVSPATGGFFDNVAQGILDQDRKRFKRQLQRYISFFWAVICCLCAGSITAFSLYAPLLQSRLLYSQTRINTVSITAELALYLPVPVFGLLVDRRGPGLLSFMASIFFGGGYILAAFTYRSGPPPGAGGDGLPFAFMILAFVGIGMGTGSMYLAAVTTCAKNFGRGKHRGAALAVPIACFGLSGMWQSQIGSRVFYERNEDGSKGDVDVFRYFLFLGCLILGVGLVGTVLLRIVDEDSLIDEAVDELEQSGLLEESDFYVPTPITEDANYGTVDQEDLRRPSTAERATRRAQKAEEKRKKSWLLNEETRRFLLDPTMWWLTGGFFLVSGPGEAFINNLGTIIGTLYPPPHADTELLNRLGRTTPATHVSIVAVASTVARILSGTLSDLLAPSSDPHAHRRGPHSLTSSLASLDPLTASSHSLAAALPKFQVSRLTLLLSATVLLSIGQALLASGAIQFHAADRFWLVSALIGTGYGAVFSLVPIVISCVWGVENFGTNWGIVATAPAGGAAVWGAAYAAVYQHNTAGGGAEKCYGTECYNITFWGMAISSWVACALWLWAWKGPGGWRARGVAV